MNTQNQSTSVHRWTVDETVDAIQHVSKNITEYSSLMRSTVKSLRKSGAIPEMAVAIREASFALRDTVNEINLTAKEIQKNNVVPETASAIEDTVQSVRNSVSVVKEMAADASTHLPQSKKIVTDGVVFLKAKHLKEYSKVGVA